MFYFHFVNVHVLTIQILLWIEITSKLAQNIQHIKKAHNVSFYVCMFVIKHALKYHFLNIW